MWYAIQTQTGREAATLDVIEHMVGGELYSECFCPQFEVLLKLRGQRVCVTKPLFPGYLLVVTSRPAELQGRLARLLEYAHVVCRDGVPVPMGEAEVAILDSFTHPGQRVVPMSLAVKEGGRVRVVDGPLMGQEVLIRHVDRHKCQAVVEMSLCGRTVSTRLGLAVLGAEDEPAVAAEALRRRATELAQAENERKLASNRQALAG